MSTVNMSLEETQEQRTEKWKKTGLLDELPESRLNECANSLNFTAQLLIDDYDRRGWKKAQEEGTKNDIDELYGKEGGFFAGISLPIVRRLYSESVSIPDMMWLYKDLKEWLKTHHPMFKDLEQVSGDVEAELCELYVKDVVSRLNNRG